MERQARPVKLPSTVDDREVFEVFGFIFGEPFRDDPLFAPTTLPPGWTMRNGDHSMYAYVLDEKSRVRALVSRKGGFYDRVAEMSLCSRYRFDHEYGENHESVYTAVLDGHIEIHRTETFRGTCHQVYAVLGKQTAAVRTWMNANRPYWQDLIKQWEEP